MPGARRSRRRAVWSAVTRGNLDDQRWRRVTSGTFETICNVVLGRRAVALRPSPSCPEVGPRVSRGRSSESDASTKAREQRPDTGARYCAGAPPCARLPRADAHAQRRRDDCARSRRDDTVGEFVAMTGSARVRSSPRLAYLIVGQPRRATGPGATTGRARPRVLGGLPAGTPCRAPSARRVAAASCGSCPSHLCPRCGPCRGLGTPVARATLAAGSVYKQARMGTASTVS